MHYSGNTSVSNNLRGFLLAENVDMNTLFQQFFFGKEICKKLLILMFCFKFWNGKLTVFFHFNFFRSPVPIPFQYAASVWGQKNLIVKRNQKSSSPVQIVAVVVSWYFVYVCTMTPHYSYMRFLSIEKKFVI